MRHIEITKNLITVILAVVFITFSNINYAQEFKLDTTSKAQIEYQPFSGLPASTTVNARITFRAENTNPTIQSSINNKFRLRIKPSQGSFLTTNDKGDTLAIEFSSRQNDSRIQRIGDQYIEDISLDLSRQKNYNFHYLTTLTQSQFAKPGIYRLLLDIDVVTLNTNEVVSNNETVEIEVLVKPKLQANIAGTSTQRNNKSKFALVDFGELETAESQTVLLQVQGNTDANITLTSKNNGRLQHKENRQSYIDYSVLFDGTKSKLQIPLNVKRAVATNLRGSSYPLKITIGNVDSAYSGRYRDIITIDVDPQ